MVEDSGAIARAIEGKITKCGGSSTLIASLPGVQRLYPAWKKAQQARVAASSLKVPLFDAVVTDYQLLGNGTGLDVIRWLQEQEGLDAPPAILFSANIHSVNDDASRLGQPVSAFFVAVIEKTGDAQADITRVMRELEAAIQVIDERPRRCS